VGKEPEHGIGVYLHSHCGFHSISPSAFLYLDLKSSAKFNAEENREKQKKAEVKAEGLPRGAVEDNQLCIAPGKCFQKCLSNLQLTLGKYKILLPFNN
jgi:hypothetical protein